MIHNMPVQCSEFLDLIERRLSDQIERGRTASHATTAEQVNWIPEPKKWSIAQILEHMMLANAPYLMTIKNGIAAAAKDPSARLKHTLFGKAIMRGAGPQGNVPAPKKLHPAPGPYTPDIIDRWAAQTQAILDLAREARGVDMCSIKVRNPFIPLLRMNLADCFMIICEHTERHVQQIEVLQDRIRSEPRRRAAV